MVTPAGGTYTSDGLPAVLITGGWWPVEIGGATISP